MHLWQSLCPPARQQHVSEQINAVARQVFQVVVADPMGFQPQDGAFELYGLDFMLDDQWHVWYLEANAFPDFCQSGQRLSGVIQDLVATTARLVVNGVGEDTGKFQLVYDMPRPGQ